MSSFLSVPNWDELQHYKDRTPPWIKLHNELLENYEFECLPDASKAHLLCIWLLASRTENKMKPDPKWIGRKIGANSIVDIDSLIKSGFLQLNQSLQGSEQDASRVLHTPEQSACLEREGEESRVEKSKDLSAKANECLAEPLEIFTFWRDTMNKDPSRTRPTAERMNKIKSRLKSYSCEEIKRAIVNCSLTPHNMGQNDRGKQFNDIELICRTDTYLETFRDSNPTQQKNINSIGTDFSAPSGWESGHEQRDLT